MRQIVEQARKRLLLLDLTHIIDLSWDDFVFLRRMFSFHLMIFR